jgi:hypothetical protein
MRYLTRAVLLILMLAIAGGLGACSKGSNASAEFGPGGTWIDDMRARVTEDIEDAETATALLVELDAIETELSAFDEKVIVFYEKLDSGPSLPTSTNRCCTSFSAATSSRRTTTC